MAYTPSLYNQYNYFETGIVESCDMKNGTCTIIRTEGGKLENVPVLNVMFGGPKSQVVNWPGDLTNHLVALIPIQGVLCVLGTLPMQAKASS